MAPAVASDPPPFPPTHPQMARAAALAAMTWAIVESRPLVARAVVASPTWAGAVVIRVIRST